ncbi:MAG: GTPase-associated system all-helical protein GASH [Janthinobacterium lividum]
MATPILQEFLNQQFIEPDQEEYITGLQKAAVEFEKRLRAKRSRIPQVVLLAFDPEAPANEPLFAEVQDLVVAKWRNFASKCQGQPVTYLRAVMLTALEALAADARLAGIVWLTASNYFRYIKPTHREAMVLQGFLATVSQVYERAGWQSWELGQGEKLPDTPSISNANLGQALTLTSDYAEKQMKASVFEEEGATSNDEIFYRISSSYVSNTAVSANEDWATDFGSIAGKTITNVANSAIREVNKVIANAASIEALNGFAAAITKQLGTVADKLERQTASHNLRSRLLWLKESQYSVSQRKSYRAIVQAARPVALAYDATKEVPEVYPASVEYFLRETLLVADPQAEEGHTFESLLADLTQDVASWQTTLTAATPAEPGRRPLLSFIAKLGQAGNEQEEFESLTGLTLTDPVSRADFAVWLFRELEVQKLVATK